MSHFMWVNAALLELVYACEQNGQSNCNRRSNVMMNVPKNMCIQRPFIQDKYVTKFGFIVRE